MPRDVSFYAAAFVNLTRRRRFVHEAAVSGSDCSGPAAKVARRSLRASPVIGQNRVLGDDDQAVEHFPAVARNTLLLRRIAEHLCAGADMAILIHDRVFDHGTVADSDWRPAVAKIMGKLIGLLIKVSAHDH